HFGEVRALAAEQVLHRGFAFGALVAEEIDELAGNGPVGGLLRRRGLRLRRRLGGGRGGAPQLLRRRGCGLLRVRGGHDGMLPCLVSDRETRDGGESAAVQLQAAGARGPRYTGGATRFRTMSNRSSMRTRSCSIVSRSRSVTVWSFIVS